MVRNGSNFMQRLGRCTILKVDELVLGRTELCVPPEKRIQRSGMNHGQWPWRCAESKVDELVNGDEQWFIPPDSGIKHWALFGQMRQGVMRSSVVAYASHQEQV